MEKKFELEKGKYLKELEDNAIIDKIIFIYDFINNNYSDISQVIKIASNNYELNLRNRMLVDFLSDYNNISKLGRKINLIKNPNNLEEIEIARNYCIFFEDLFFKIIQRDMSYNERGIDGLEEVNKEEIKPMYDFFVDFINIDRKNILKYYRKQKERKSHYLDIVKNNFVNDKKTIESFMEDLALYEDIEFYRFNYLETILWVDEFMNDSRFPRYTDYVFRDQYYYQALETFDEIYFYHPIKYVLTCDDDSIINIVSPKFHELFIEKHKEKKEDVYEIMDDISSSLVEFIFKSGFNYSDSSDDSLKYTL